MIIHWNTLAASCVLLLSTVCDLKAQESVPLDKHAKDASAEFRGQPIGYWVERLRQGPVKELEDAGEKALPIWVAAARDPQAIMWVRHAMSSGLEREDWVGPIYIAMLNAPAPFRTLAIADLQRRPKVAGKVAPEIVDFVREWPKVDGHHIRHDLYSAIQLLVSLDPPPSATIQLVNDVWPSAQEDGFLERYLLELLATAKPSKEGVHTLLEIYREHQPSLATLQVYANKVDQEGIAEIVAVSHSADPTTRRLAAAMIDHLTTSEIGKADVEMLSSEIERLLLDHDYHVRQYALRAARSVNGAVAARSLIPTLENILSDDDAKSRHAAASALAKFGRKAVPVIQSAAESERSDVRVAACSAIAGMEPVPDEAIEILLELADDPNGEVRNYAVFSMGESQSDDPRVTEELIQALDDPKTQDWATRALGTLGPKARTAVPKLRQRLESEDLSIRLLAASALWAVDRDAERVLPIAKAVANDDRGISSAAYYSVYRNVDGKRIEERTNYRYPLAARAAELLGQMGAAAEPAVDELVNMLQHENPQAQSAALKALGQLGRTATSAIPKLRKLVETGAFPQAQRAIDMIQSANQDKLPEKRHRPRS
ncbi:MAG: HEAT repeat domain-containing protein [bacterium]|nr:HEAT repeat domain-containing protein [bacterium]